MNSNPLIAKQFNPFVRKSSASPLSSLADTNLNTVQEPQAETTTEAEAKSESESEAVTDQTNQNQPEIPVDVDAAPSPAADLALVSGEVGAASTAESGTPSPDATVSAEEAKAPVQEDTAEAPQAQQAASSDASGHQSRRHRRLN
jgi:hypothetical protein